MAEEELTIAKKSAHGTWGFKPLVSVATQIAFFWQLRLYQWWTTPSRKQLLLDSQANAQVFEEWLAASYTLDDIEENNLWRQTFASKYYDYKLISERLQTLIEACDAGDVYEMIAIIRSGMIRNLGNITAPRLFSRAYAGTKLLIEDYISQVALAVETVAEWPTGEGEDSLASQTKLDILHDTRQALGRTVLVLQGGSIFGLCHLGVLKALHLRGLLPRIVSGSATGALIAALVATHSEDELVHVLSGDGIDLTAFTSRSKEAAEHTHHSSLKHGWLSTLIRRIRRLMNSGYLLDANALDECVRANIGDITFIEAYQKSKRILNITITHSSLELPSLLNYVTSPNVLIRSAAIASNHPSEATSPPQLLCKDEHGNIQAWSGPHNSDYDASAKHKYANEREGPMNRIAELFNVNHFIVSQARPYVAPFLQSDLGSPKPRYAGRRSISSVFLKVLYMEIQHRLHQLDSLGYLSSSSRRFLMDETVPGPSLTLVPQVSLSDFSTLLENPTKESLDYWILKGERSVWPAVSAIKIRTVVEVELDRGYQFVRRWKPLDVQAETNGFTLADRPPAKKRRKRARASTAGDDV